MLGVTFTKSNTDYKTSTSWGLHWSSYTLSEPVAITNYIDIPGRKTKIDATEALYGGVTYENRTLTLEFWKDINYKEWMTLNSTINNAIGGQRVKITLDSDPGYYWQGRVTVQSHMEYPNLCLFTITADIEPYKYDSKGGSSL